MLLSLLLSIIGILLTIFIVIGVHEGAHFLMARMLGIKVLRCSIGFGKALYTWHDKKGTEYVIAAIPLGGYVKMVDENEETVTEADKPFAFNRQPLYKRFAVVAAGPFSNLLSAVILYWVILVAGFDTIIPIIGTVDARSIAAEAGLKPRQEITSVDGHTTLSWTSVAMRLVMHTGDHDNVIVDVKNPETTSNVAHSHLLNLDTWHMNNLKPDPLTSLGINPYMPEIPLVVAVIKPDSPAAASPLQVGDRIVDIDGKPIHSWDNVLAFIEKNPDKLAMFSIHRQGKLLKLPIQLGSQRNILFQKHGFLGIGPHFDYPKNLLRTIKYNPLDAVPHAVDEVVQLSYLNLLLFGKLLTHKLSVFTLGGPITIFETAGSAFQYGILPFLSFLAFLNVAIGILNFFPIPGLDGGHLFFQAVECITRKPLSTRVQLLFYRLGLLLLVFILIQAVTNDLLRIWSS